MEGGSAARQQLVARMLSPCTDVQYGRCRPSTPSTWPSMPPASRSTASALPIGSFAWSCRIEREGEAGGPAACRTEREVEELQDWKGTGGRRRDGNSAIPADAPQGVGVAAGAVDRRVGHRSDGVGVGVGGRGRLQTSTRHES